MAKAVKKNTVAIKPAAKPISKQVAKKADTNAAAQKKASVKMKAGAKSAGTKESLAPAKGEAKKGTLKQANIGAPSKSLKPNKQLKGKADRAVPEKIEVKSDLKEEPITKTKSPIQSAMKKLSEKASGQKAQKPNLKIEKVESPSQASEESESKSVGKKAKSGIKIVGKVDVGAGDSVDKLTKKWANLYKKAQNTQAQPYNMAHVYEANVAIEHKIHGWGFILENRNDRLEVLFQSGIKYLISNYKS